MMYSLFKLTIELPDFVQGETCYNYMFVIFLEYDIYDAVYVNTNKITRQSTGLTCRPLSVIIFMSYFTKQKFCSETTGHI
jgi:hypothetical protein